MYRIRLLNSIPVPALSRLSAGHYRVGVDVEQPDAVLIGPGAVEPFEFGPGLRAVARAAAGSADLPVRELTARGIPVFTAVGAQANAVKELVLAGMLLASRRLPEAMAALRSADLDHPEAIDSLRERLHGSELAGRTLGVVGLGLVGVQVANAARALGMRVLGLDPELGVDGAWQLDAEVMQAGSLNELFAGSDYISFHVPASEATAGLFDRNALMHLRKGVVLLNFSHPDVVAAAALREGFAEDRIGRYVTDFPTRELLACERVIALPRLGAATREAGDNAAAMVIGQLRAFLENGEIRHAVNFPGARMVRSGRARLCVAHRDRPNMIGPLAQAVGAAGLNIAQMRSAARVGLSYSLIDVDAEIPESVLRTIAEINGVLSLRVV